MPLDHAAGFLRGTPTQKGPETRAAPLCCFTEARSGRQHNLSNKEENILCNFPLVKHRALISLFKNNKKHWLAQHITAPLRGFTHQHLTHLCADSNAWVSVFNTGSSHTLFITLLPPFTPIIYLLGLYSGVGPIIKNEYFSVAYHSSSWYFSDSRIFVHCDTLWRNCY